MAFISVTYILKSVMCLQLISLVDGKLPFNDLGLDHPPRLKKWNHTFSCMFWGWEG